MFDPITVLNPANPTELVYAWDPRVTAIKQFPPTTGRWGAGAIARATRSRATGTTAGGPTSYYTDAMGKPMAASNPLALLQVISAHNSIGAPATTDGQGAFKVRRSYCQQRRGSGSRTGDGWGCSDGRPSAVASFYGGVRRQSAVRLLRRLSWWWRRVRRPRRGT